MSDADMDSDGDYDQYYKIPRGAADCEIDSDLASGCESEPGAPASSARAPRADINAAAALLRRAAPDAADPAPPSSDSESDAEGDARVPDELLNAATGHADFAARARSRREARALRATSRAVVDGPGLERGVGAAPGGGESHADVLRMLVGKVEEARGGAGVSKLKKKFEKVVAEKALDAPLPAVVAGRVARGVAYGKTNEEVARWEGTVKENRKKALAFPLNEPGGAAARSSREVALGMKPVNDFEREVEQLLKEGGVVTDAAVLRREEEMLQEASASVSKEEIIKRRRELSRMRAAVFEQGRKLKRIKKIKSKKFRRHMKMEKARVAEEARAAGFASDEDDQEAAIAAERRRVEERMTLKHKNTSKWVRRQLSRGEVKRNPNARAAVEEQLRLHEELRKKQTRSDALGGGQPVEEDSGSESGMDGMDDSDLDSDEAEARDEQQIRELKESLQKPSSKPKKGVLALKFMQEAEERRRKQALQLLEEMENSDGEDEGSDDVGKSSDDERADGSKKQSSRDSGEGDGLNEGAGDDALEARGGRDDSEDKADSAKLVDKATAMGELVQRKLAGNGGSDLLFKALAEAEGSDEENEPGFTTNVSGRVRAGTSEYSAPPKGTGAPVVKAGASKSKKSVNFADSEKKSKSVGETKEKKAAAPAVPEKSSNAGAADVGENPWLQPVSTSNRRARKRTMHVEELAIPITEPKNTVVDDKDKLRPAKRARFSTDEAAGASEPDKPNGEAADKQQAATAPGSSLVSDSELSRMMLTAQAFAGAGGADLSEFLATKEREIEQSLPTAKDIGAEVLPGWGGWAGAGAVRMNKRGEPAESSFAKAAREKLDAARAAAVSARVDGRSSHVIVTARRAKKAADLSMAAVPFPFTSSEQWEQEVATPLVRERLTGASHSQAIRPGVIVKRGAAVQPIRESIAVAAERRAADKTGAIVRKGRRARQRDGKRRSLLS